MQGEYLVSWGAEARIVVGERLSTFITKLLNDGVESVKVEMFCDIEDADALAERASNGGFSNAEIVEMAAERVERAFKLAQEQGLDPYSLLAEDALKLLD